MKNVKKKVLSIKVFILLASGEPGEGLEGKDWCSQSSPNEVLPNKVAPNEVRQIKFRQVKFGKWSFAKENILPKKSFVKKKKVYSMSEKTQFHPKKKVLWKM